MEVLIWGWWDVWRQEFIKDSCFSKNSKSSFLRCFKHMYFISEWINLNENGMVFSLLMLSPAPASIYMYYIYIKRCIFFMCQRTYIQEPNASTALISVLHVYNTCPPIPPQFDSLFIYLASTQYFLWARHYSRCWGYIIFLSNGYNNQIINYSTIAKGKYTAVRLCNRGDLIDI